MPTRKPSPDLIVVGGGVIGLAVAMLAVRNGLTIRIVDAGLPGAASRVAAGLLAPSLGRLPAGAAAAFQTANAGYDGFVAGIRQASGHAELSVGKGILEVALADDDVRFLNEAMDLAAIRLTSDQIVRQAPDLVAVGGAMLHVNDGWIDPQSLLAGLAAALPTDAQLGDRVAGIHAGPDLGVRLESGGIMHCGQIVVAAGSWSPLIDGLPTRLPIVPARGEVIVVETSHSLPFAIACEGGYLVPRSGAIVVGSTFELGGYNSQTTVEGRSRLEHMATVMIPGPMARATRTSSWAGLRPMTPDKLPIIDRDPVDPRIVYACGHGKNGLLLAGLTSQIVLDLLGGNRQETASPFTLGRFKTE